MERAMLKNILTQVWSELFVRQSKDSPKAEAGVNSAVRERPWQGHLGRR